MNFYCSSNQFTVNLFSFSELMKFIIPILIVPIRFGGEHELLYSLLTLDNLKIHGDINNSRFNFIINV